jgi:hypothetical protein
MRIWQPKWAMATVASAVLSLCAAAGGEELRRAQVSAATVDAVDSLYIEIAAMPIGQSITVEQLLEQMDRKGELIRTLQHAEQMGPPRWISGHTCQVQLQISGSRVGKALVEIASSDPRKTPVTPEVLAQRVKEWEARVFTATGSSIAPEHVEEVRPGESSEAWAGISDETRRRVISEARRSAERAILDSIAPVRGDFAGQRATLQEVFEHVPSIRAELKQWIRTRPITSLEFSDDLRVSLVISSPAEDLLQALVTALQSELAVTLTEQAAADLRDQMERQVARASGHAKAIQAAAREEPVVQAPMAKPQWITQQLEATGGAAFVESQLKTARAAEANAVQEIRLRILDLPWCDGLTIGQAAERDPQMQRALDYALTRVHIVRTEYEGEQEARVHVRLDLRELWEALRQSNPRVGRSGPNPAPVAESVQ